MSTETQTVETFSEASMVAGRAKAIQSLNATVAEIAPTNIPVLIFGESGTGKHVYARLIHRLSSQSDSKFTKLNCSTADPAREFAEFSPRIRQSISLPQTIFLDALDELDLAGQRALLSVLPDAFSESQPDSFPVRIVSSTAKDLEAVVKSGHFRKELYFRVAGVCLRLPALRERKEDIEPMLEFFLRESSKALNKPVPVLDRQTLEILMGYDWPGNIRELENLARKMVALGETRFVAAEFQKPPQPARPVSFSTVRPSLKIAARAASREKERELILDALDRTKWNRKRAAQDLRISYKALLYKLKQIGSSETGE
ncbi:MAG: sigma-54-dependent Fis family transcriptional regulator [Acidobacteria bacterium]|nr:sigma-54-dependent Fis family transcriptional regulator [Acidobacteriota bacterium]MBS1865002.1 sigma-54-dependent Fis family transcriptional regulator [Acidobacteriota bacterium]